MKTTIKKYIDLKCEKCHCDFKKEIKEHNRKIKQGKTKFFCSLQCYNEANETDAQDMQKYRQKEDAPFKRMLSRARCHIKRNSNYAVTVTLDDLKEKWKQQAGRCPYTGLKMTLQFFDETSPLTASLDRIDSSKGYTKENTELTCVSVNLAKNGFSKEMVLDFFRQIKNA